jgi:nucleoside-diphosphate-sugar epimerase
MISCGITGHNGNLGKKFIKTFNKIKYDKFKGDISKKGHVDDWIKKNNFDLILHFASIVPTSIVKNNYKKAYRVNVEGTKFLVDSIIKYQKNIKWFFFASTSHVYKSSSLKIRENFPIKPVSKYGLTKYDAENYVLKKLKPKKIKHCIGRIFSIADNKGKEFLIPSLLKKFKTKKKSIEFEDLNHYRDFITTKQISRIIYLLWLKKISGIINIANGEKIFLKDIALYLGEKNNKNIIFKDTNKMTKIIANISRLKAIKYKFKRLKFFEFFQ